MTDNHTDGQDRDGVLFMAEAPRTAAREAQERYRRLLARNAQKETLTEEEQMFLFNQEQQQSSQQQNPAAAEAPMPDLQSEGSSSGRDGLECSNSGQRHLRV